MMRQRLQAYSEGKSTASVLQVGKKARGQQNKKSKVIRNAVGAVASIHSARRRR